MGLKSITFLILVCVLAVHVQHSFAIVSTPQVVTNEDDLFPVSIIHINDFHARFEETNEQATSCKPGEKCIGGYARAVTAIKQLQAIRPNPIFLNAGDNFQGTLWYSFGRWNVTKQFLNMLNADAITLGNHEFDHGVPGVVPFMESLESPTIVANIDDTDEPTFQGKYKPSIIIDRYGRKIGVIGIIVSDVDEISNTGKLRFYKEEEAIKREATKLKQQGVDIIIVLSHCGLDVDYRIAKEAAPFVDVIVGGHSHTFMYTVGEGETAPGPDIVKDVYPAVVKNGDGHTVLIVQASAYIKYVGDITVYFDKQGNVAKWEGQPFYLDNHIKPDEEVLKAIQPWKEIIDAKGQRIVGKTKVTLLNTPCSMRECNLGNFVADALAHYYITELTGKNEGAWLQSVIALVPTGAIRTTLNKGSISYNDLATTVPFENSIDTFELQGEHLKTLFEYVVKGSWQTTEFDGKYFTQVSGMRVVYNMTNEEMNRVVSIEVMTVQDTDHTPKYEPLNPTKYYKCVSSSFLADGGDGFEMIKKYKRNHTRGNIDIDVVIKYMEDRKIIYTKLEDRIKFID
ncbi:apyrase-like [Sitodiplosis mosellana]|uniref:apyrase-like n=1 Tax=Sitodiplosis mosellana TaxID=263140 RepID=UPI0024445134|nr:apyrase-like [Sitodiplosis mosellana]